MNVEPSPVRTIITAAITIVVVLGGLLGARILVRWWHAERPQSPPMVAVTTPVKTAISEMIPGSTGKKISRASVSAVL